MSKSPNVLASLNGLIGLVVGEGGLSSEGEKLTAGTLVLRGPKDVSAFLPGSEGYSAALELWVIFVGEESAAKFVGDIRLPQSVRDQLISLTLQKG